MMHVFFQLLKQADILTSQNILIVGLSVKLKLSYTTIKFKFSSFEKPSGLPYR
jgi:hypothetical protein